MKARKVALAAARGAGLLTLAIASGAVSPLGAQARGNADAEADAARCRNAARIVETGLPAHKFTEARGQLDVCPGHGQDVYPAAMRRLRTATDTAALQVLYNRAFSVVDSGLYAAAAEIAADRGASAHARVLAFRTLTAYVGYPAGRGRWFPLESAWQVRETDLPGGCYPGSFSVWRPTPRPLPADWEATTGALADAVAADGSSPVPARWAATCFRHALRLK